MPIKQQPPFFFLLAPNNCHLLLAYQHGTSLCTSFLQNCTHILLLVYFILKSLPIISIYQNFLYKASVPLEHAISYLCIHPSVDPWVA